MCMSLKEMDAGRRAGDGKETKTRQDETKRREDRGQREGERKISVQFATNLSPSRDH